MTQRTPVSRTVVLAGLVGAAVPAALMVALHLAERASASCESTAMFGCSGPALTVLAVGVPVAYVAFAVGMRLLRVRLPWLAPLAVAVVSAQVVPQLGRLGVPAEAVLVVPAALAAGWARWLGPSSAGPARPATAGSAEAS